MASPTSNASHGVSSVRPPTQRVSAAKPAAAMPVYCMPLMPAPMMHAGKRRPAAGLRAGATRGLPARSNAANEAATAITPDAATRSGSYAIDGRSGSAPMPT